MLAAMLTALHTNAYLLDCDDHRMCCMRFTLIQHTQKTDCIHMPGSSRRSMGRSASRCNSCHLAAHLVHQVYHPAD